MKKILLMLTTMEIVMTMASCGNSSRSDSGYSPNGGWSSAQSDDYDYSNSHQTQMVSCPMCGGTGVFDYMPGDAFAPKYQCPACNGNGVCTAQQAQEAIQAKAQAEAMMNGGYSSGGGYSNGGGSGRSVEQIEYDLRKAYDLLKSTQEDYNNCTSGVLKAQYPQMIADQKAYIARLEAELRNAQY